MSDQPWFRMNAQIADRPVIWRAMQHLDLTLSGAVGYMAMFWGALSRNCPGGFVGHVPDTVLETWARWTGEPGKFAKFIREHHTDKKGKINDYDEYMQPLDDRREYDRVRKQLYRQEKKKKLDEMKAQLTPNVPDNSGTNPRDIRRDVHRDVQPHDTIRNETIRNDIQKENKEVVIKFSTTATLTKSEKGKLDELTELFPDSHWHDLAIMLEIIQSHELQLYAWIAGMLGMLQGMGGPGVKPDRLAAAVREWVGSDHAKRPVFRQFRAYTHDYNWNGGWAGSQDSGPQNRNTGEVRGRAIILLAEIRTRRNDNEWLANLPLAAKVALQAIGGIKRVKSTDETKWSFLARDFVDALAGAEGLEAAGKLSESNLTAPTAKAMPTYQVEDEQPEDADLRARYNTEQREAAKRWESENQEAAEKVWDEVRTELGRMAKVGKGKMVELTVYEIFAGNAKFPDFNTWKKAL